jgi:hypothetical protein
MSLPAIIGGWRRGRMAVPKEVPELKLPREIDNELAMLLAPGILGSPKLRAREGHRTYRLFYRAVQERERLLRRTCEEKRRKAYGRFAEGLWPVFTFEELFRRWR